MNIKTVVIPLISMCISLCTLLLSFSCENLSATKAPRSVAWIDVATGLTDSTLDNPKGLSEKKAFAKKLDNSGFKLTWKRVKEADFYEIRAARTHITPINWENATIVATVPNSNSSEISTVLHSIKAKVYANNCTGCEKCVNVCPLNAITMVNMKAIINPDSCSGCGKCYDACEFNAIADFFMGKNYYFAIRAFSNSSQASDEIACTYDSYKLRYINIAFMKIKIAGTTIDKRICGHCDYEGCYINQPKFGPGCPVDAIYANKDRLIIIDQSKCIYCGLCLEQCGIGGGFWSVRRQVVSSSSKD